MFQTNFPQFGVQQMREKMLGATLNDKVKQEFGRGFIFEFSAETKVGVSSRLPKWFKKTTSGERALLTAPFLLSLWPPRMR